MAEAVFFDLDGTLIDTERLALDVGRQVFADLGFPVDDAFMHSLVGQAEPAVARLVGAALPGIDLDALGQGWRDAFRAGLDAGVPLKPGAADLLQALQMPLGLVTSTRREGAFHKLGLAGLTHHFQAIVTLEDVKNPKPAPDPYLLAAETLGVDPCRCVVFEDSDTGALAARRAGCIVVQVPDIAPTDGPNAHHLVADLWAGARAAGLL